MRTNQAAPSFRVELLPESVLAKPLGKAPSGDRSNYYEVYEDHDGRIWLGTYDGGEILCLKPSPSSSSSRGIPAGPGGEWTLYNESDGLVTHRLPQILQLQNGTICVASYASYSGINQFDGATWKNINLQKFGVTEECTSLVQTRDGALWVGCNNGAVCVSRDGQWKVYQAPQVPIPAARAILLQSSDGALWVGGQDAEVLRLDYQTPHWFTYQDLNFEWESPQGTQWFIHRDGRVVVHEGDHWTSYGTNDGLIDTPTALLGTRNGDIWVAGSHQHTAASARFDGRTWTRHTHGDLSWAVDWRALYESADGSVWFGASVDSAGLGKPYLRGLMQYHQGQWIHHAICSTAAEVKGLTNVVILPQPLPSFGGQFYGLGQSRDGKIWGGQTIIVNYDGQTWDYLRQNQDFRIGTIEAICTTREGALWIGSRQRGVFRYNGTNWQRFHVHDGLIANNVRSIAETTDRSIWVATDRGVSRFDGQDWSSDVLPAVMNMARESGSLKASPSGALWINHASRQWNRRAWPKAVPFDTSSGEFWTVCYQLDRLPPQTSLTLGPKKVSQPGDITISWKGTDPWQETKDSDLQYSFRLDGGRWSSFSGAQTHAFFSLPRGRHHFEVRARDHDFNVDPEPATLDFEVVPPVWRQAWFIGLMGLLAVAILTQTIRVFLRGWYLRRTNRALAAEVEERKRIEREVEQTHKQLLQASHQAGMAEVATNVLHNVGNVLNSVNVSAEFVADRIQQSKITDLPRVAGLLAEHAREPHYLATDEKGKRIPEYLTQLSSHLVGEQQTALKELASLRHNINHIKDIVAMQQEYSRLAGFTESVKLTELVEDALRLNDGALIRHNVRLVRDFQEQGNVVVEKHKVLQVLVNLIRNAKYACDESGRQDRQLSIQTIRLGNDRVQIRVSDNGVGIPTENLTKIFGQGFTTRKSGHGFGLHSSANAARQLGGSLTARSDGPGKGACFTLEIPVTRPMPVKGQSSTLHPS